MKPLLGWIPPHGRTDEQSELHERIVRSLPKFAIEGRTRELANGEKVMLTDYWKHPAVIEQIGFAFPGIHQLTGSCVGAGGGNMLFTLNAVEAIQKGTPEAIVVPFWLLPYGRSRYDEGDRGQGEGSMGSSFAQAVKEDGFLDAADSRLPKYTTTAGLTWSEADEMRWSDGGAISGDFLRDSRLHIVKTFSILHGAQEVWDAIVNGYPVTRADMRWTQPGSEQLSGSGDNAVVTGPLDGNGGHQETWLNVWKHPDKGPLIFEANQWTPTVYKTDPSVGSGCGVWRTVAQVDSICKSQYAEIIAFSGLQGYPARELTYNLF